MTCEHANTKTFEGPASKIRRCKNQKKSLKTYLPLLFSVKEVSKCSGSDFFDKQKKANPVFRRLQKIQKKNWKPKTFMDSVIDCKNNKKSQRSCTNFFKKRPISKDFLGQLTKSLRHQESQRHARKMHPCRPSCAENTCINFFNGICRCEQSWTGSKQCQPKEIIEPFNFTSQSQIYSNSPFNFEDSALYPEPPFHRNEELSATYSEVIPGQVGWDTYERQAARNSLESQFQRPPQGFSNARINRNVLLFSENPEAIQQQFEHNALTNLFLEKRNQSCAFDSVDSKCLFSKKPVSDQSMFSNPYTLKNRRQPLRLESAKIQGQLSLELHQKNAINYFVCDNKGKRGSSESSQSLQSNTGAPMKAHKN